MPLEDWYRLSGTGAAFIEPGSPWQHPYVESLNVRLRDELLNQELFFTLLEAQVLAEGWRTDHNKNHPHSALACSAPLSSPPDGDKKVKSHGNTDLVTNTRGIPIDGFQSLCWRVEGSTTGIATSTPQVRLAVSARRGR